MKSFKIIFALYTLLYSGLTLPVRPISSATAYAICVASGMNIGASYKKRTQAVIKSDFDPAVKQERLLFTGAAVLLGVGISVAALKRVPPHF